MVVIKRVDCITYQEISLKKIYDEVTGDILDMSNVIILKKLRRKKMGDVFYFHMS